MSENDNIDTTKIRKKLTIPEKLILTFEENPSIMKEQEFKLEELEVIDKRYVKVLNRMLKFGLLVPGTEDTDCFYVNRNMYESFLENEKKRLFMIIVSIAIPSALFLLLAIAWIIII